MSRGDRHRGANLGPLTDQHQFAVVKPPMVCLNARLSITASIVAGWPIRAREWLFPFN
jgi:hypothetical protein